MGTKIAIISISFTLIFVSCGSAEVKPLTAVCSIKKHVKDDIYQVLIDDKPVNDRWYLKQDAEEIKIILGVRKKCLR